MSVRDVRVLLLLSGLSLGLLSSLDGAPRDIQIRSVDFTTNVIELFNFGVGIEALDSWRFCTHNSGDFRVYSSPSGLNGVQIGAGKSFFIHLDNDAPGDGNSINASTVGLFAKPFDTGAYGLNLYFPPTSFLNGNQIADHLQWNIGGVDNQVADERSDEAEFGGLWSDQSAWIATTSTTTRISLTDQTGGILHGPADYEVTDALVDCNDNQVDDADDIVAGASQDCNTNEIPDECDIAAGASQDCNTNEIPDECDIAAGTSQDCNTNEIPDECDIGSGISQDCNTNKIPDQCDIAVGRSVDDDDDGIPDECSGDSVFNRGDANDDGAVDISDASFILGFLFLGSAVPGCLDAADANGDGQTDISDGSYVLVFLFLGGFPPPDPGLPAAGCGPAPAVPEPQGCARFEHCE